MAQKHDFIRYREKIHTVAIQRDNATLKKEISIWNNTGYKYITFIDRHNMKIPIYDRLNSSYKGLILRTTYVIPMKSLKDTYTYFLSGKPPECNIEIWNVLQELVLHEYEKTLGAIPKAFNARISIQTNISEKYFDDVDGVYMDTNDLAFSILDPISAPNHPYDDHELLEEKYRNLINDDVSFLYCIDIVDNNNVVNNKWVYFNNEVFCINPRVDYNKDNGLYLYRSNIKNKSPTIIRKELSELKENGIYNTKDEALTNGNPSIIEKARIQKQEEELKLKNNELENKLRQLRHDFDMEKEEYAAQTKKTEYEYKEKINKQKTNNENLKTISTIIITTLGLYAAFQKVKK